MWTSINIRCKCIPGTSDPALLSKRCLSHCSGVICEAPAFWIFSNGNFLIQLGTGMNRLWPKILVQSSLSILVSGCLSSPKAPPSSALQFFAPACLADACFQAMSPKAFVGSSSDSYLEVEAFVSMAHGEKSSSSIICEAGGACIHCKLRKDMKGFFVFDHHVGFVRGLPNRIG